MKPRLFLSAVLTLLALSAPTMAQTEGAKKADAKPPASATQKADNSGAGPGAAADFSKVPSEQQKPKSEPRINIIGEATPVVVLNGNSQPATPADSPNSAGGGVAFDGWVPAAVAALLAMLVGAFLARSNGQKIAELHRQVNQQRTDIEDLHQSLTRFIKVQNNATPASDPASTKAVSSQSASSAGQEESRYDTSTRADTYAAPPPLPPASPAPPSLRLEELRQEIASLIDSPGMKSSDYEAALQRHGQVWGLEIALDGSTAKLVRPESDTARRISAVVLPGQNRAVLVPSSRFVKEFAMTFKETLEAGHDVKAAFDTQVDGSAKLRLVKLAVAQLDQSMQVIDIEPGKLAGFIA